MSIDFDQIYQEWEDKKALVEVFRKGFAKDTRKIYPAKVANLALKASQSLATDNKNIKVITALVLLSISAQIDLGSAQKLVSRAMALLG